VRHRLTRSLVAPIAAVLAFTAAPAGAAVVFDFGTGAGQIQATGVSYFGNGSTGGTRTVTHTADALQFSGTFGGTGTFQTQGTTFNVPNTSLAGFSPTDKVAISTTFGTANPAHQTDGNLLDYFRIAVIFRNSATGALNTFRFQDGVTGTPPFRTDGTFQLVIDQNSSLGAPEGTGETPLTSFDQIQLLYQNADDPASTEGPQSFNWQIDRLEIVSVPEPAAFALLVPAAAAAALLRRRRAARA